MRYVRSSKALREETKVRENESSLRRGREKGSRASRGTSVNIENHAGVRGSFNPELKLFSVII